MSLRRMYARALPVMGVAAALSCGSAHAAAIYNGNGGTGFGGAVGTGNVTISDTTAGLTITLNRGSGPLNDALDLYVDTQPGGFSSTATFGDNGDPGRNAISSFGSLVTFPAGFGADYGISVENGFIGVFQLESGGSNSFNYLFGQGQSGSATAASYSITLTPAQLNQIGITGVGQSFGFVGTYTSTSDYRSNETIGATSPDISQAGNPGNPSSISFSTADIYTTTAVPEPASIGLLAMGGLALIARRVKKPNRDIG